MQVFVIINNVRVIKKADVNANNWLIKEDGTKDLFRILVTSMWMW